MAALELTDDPLGLDADRMSAALVEERTGHGVDVRVDPWHAARRRHLTGASGSRARPRSRRGEAGQLDHRGSGSSRPSRPAASARCAAASSITPSCIHTAPTPASIASSTCAPAIGPPEDVDRVDPLGLRDGLQVGGACAEDLVHVRLTGMTRNPRSWSSRAIRWESRRGSGEHPTTAHVCVSGCGACEWSRVSCARPRPGQRACPCPLHPGRLASPNPGRPSRRRPFITPRPLVTPRPLATPVRSLPPARPPPPGTASKPPLDVSAQPSGISLALYASDPPFAAGRAPSGGSVAHVEPPISHARRPVPF